MNQAKIIIFIVIVAVIIIELFLIFGEQLPVYEQVNHMVTTSARERLTQTLASDERRVGIAPPETNVWKAGESGLYLLGIRNRYSETKEFYVNVYLEGLEGSLSGREASDYQSRVKSWLSYFKGISLDPQDSGIINIVIKSEQDAESGIYILRAVICEDANCNTLSDSSGIYSSIMFTLVLV